MEKSIRIFVTISPDSWYASVISFSLFFPPETDPTSFFAPSRRAGRSERGQENVINSASDPRERLIIKRFMVTPEHDREK
jgi:hypothetical protein